MPTCMAGRRKVNGTLIDGTGFTYECGEVLSGLLAQRISPLFSQPTTGEWVFGLVTRAASDGVFERGAGIFPVGNAGPPEHFHPNYSEQFQVVLGGFLFTLNGKEHHARAGEELTIPPGTPHTFRCTGADPGCSAGVVIVETRPAARTGEVISTLFGMAHEGLLTQSGQPRFLHAMMIASEYADDTLFTSPPPALVSGLATLLAPFARWRGYRATEARYLEPSFWDEHVEQPILDVADS